MVEMSEVGIDDIAVYVPKLYIDQREIARARGIAPEKITKGLELEQMAVPDIYEDSVTLAANAAQKLFERGGISRDDVGRLVVGTETGVDASKPIAAYLHELLKLPFNAEIYEVKHACVGGAYALEDAMNWVRVGRHDGKSALVICTDIARYEIGSPGEPTQGAGAVAMAVKDTARLAVFENVTGTFSKNVRDFWRPLTQDCAIVDGKYSNECYLNALDGAYHDYLRRSGGRRVFDFYVFHTPYPKIARKAMAQVLSFERKEQISPADVLIEARVGPSLVASRQVGNIYTGSAFLALASLLENRNETDRDAHIGLFVYGSGCSAKFFSANIGCSKKDVGLGRMLEQRKKISITEYEDLRRGECMKSFTVPELFSCVAVDSQGYRYYECAKPI